MKSIGGRVVGPRLRAALVAATVAALLASLVMVLPAPGQSATGVWKTLPSTGLSRQEVSYVQLGGKFYLAGGGTAHQEFDPATGKWRNLEPLPAALDHIQGVAVGGRIYYIGGLASWPSPHSGTVYIYDTASDTFTAGASMGARGRGAGGVAVHDGKIYYAGGLASGAAVKWFDVYDPVANKWTPLPDMPTARDHFQAAVVGGRFWAVGGRKKDIHLTEKVNEAYRFDAGVWEAAFSTTGYTPRGGFAAAAVGDEVFVIGGEGRVGATDTVFDTVEAYNTRTDDWRTLAPMPEARHGIQGAVCNGGIYVAAGGVAAGHHPSQGHDVFFPGGVEKPCPEPPAPDPGGDPTATPAPPGDDPAGPGAGAGGGDDVRPVLDGLTVRARGNAIRVRGTLSEPASVRLIVERVTRGRRVGRRCVRPAAGPIARPQCRRYTRVARRLLAEQTAGRLNVRIRSRRLRPGRHRLAALAVDAAANRSRVVRKTFRLERVYIARR